MTTAPSMVRNIAANYLGSGWSALLGLCLVPIYIRYLGIESYALIGILLIMQACASLLDVGIAPTLNREMARYTAGSHSSQSIRDLLYTLEVVSIAIAVVLAGCFVAASSYLARDWLKPERIPLQDVSEALSIMGSVVALRLVEGIYHGTLLGLQRQVWYNAASALFSSIRFIGAIAILEWVSSTVQAFFLWQVLVSAMSTAAFAGKVRSTLPRPARPTTFSLAALSEVRTFATGVLGISFLAILLTQIDKVLLSKLLTLEIFGYYTLAATLCGVIPLAIVPITQAVYPRMVELASRGDNARLVQAYHSSSQLVTVLTAPVMGLLVVFADGILFLWTGDRSISENSAPVLSALAFGTFLNGLMYVPAQLQLAYAWTKLGIATNAVAVAIIVPAIILVVPEYGAQGAAWVWIALNAGYVLISMQFMHRRLVRAEKFRWYWLDVAMPASAAFLVVVVASLLRPMGLDHRWQWLVFVSIVGSLSLAAAVLSAPELRRHLGTSVGKVLKL